MSLQFILGGAGSGKSYDTYMEFLENAQKNPTKKYIVLVPEQFTLYTQKLLTSLSENKVILNLDVQSFERLAFKIMEELYLTDTAILRETGKSLLMRKALIESEEKLKTLGSNVKKMGFINELKSAISELMQYQITPKELSKSVEKTDGAIYLKMNDLSIVYEKFLELIHKEYIASEEVLGFVASYVEKSEIVKGSDIFLDGYTGFTPSELTLINKLLIHCDNVKIAFTIDNEALSSNAIDIQDIFFLSKASMQEITKLARSEGVDILKSKIMTSSGEKRFKNAKALCFLEENIFRNKEARYESEQSNIQIAALPDGESEIKYAAAKIAGMVRHSGARYKDFAIICSEVDSYKASIKKVMSEYEIPYFMDEKSTLKGQRFIEAITDIIEVIEHNFTPESVLGTLKSGYFDLTTDECDMLENYVISFGIRGYKRWRDKWVIQDADYDVDKLEVINEIKDRFMTKIIPLAEIIKKNNSARVKINALYEFIVSYNMQDKLFKWQQYFENRGEVLLAKEYSQVYKKLMDLFDKMVVLLGDEKLSLSDFSKIFDAGLEAEKIGVIPPGNDYVQIADAIRSRIGNIKVLFFVGVNDGKVPSSSVRCGLFTQQDRIILKKKDINIAKDATEQAFIQRFYLYLALTKPKEQLYISYSKTIGENKVGRPSYLIRTMMRMFTKIEVLDFDEQIASLLTKQSAFSYLLKLKQDKARLGLEDDYISILEGWFEHNDYYKNRLKMTEQAISYTYAQNDLDKEIAKKLYSDDAFMSITRLEMFASCAFEHFMNYGLHLKQRKEYEFNAADFGTVIHKVLEKYFSYIKENEIDSSKMTEEEKERIADEYLDEAILTEKNAAIFENGRMKYMIYRMKRLIHRSIWVIEKQIEENNMIPTEFELMFSSDDGIDATKIDVQGYGKVQLLGKIDRVDIRQDENNVDVRVVDYKTGVNEFSLEKLYNGLQLQLVVYMKAAMELLKKKNPKKNLRADGAYYYHIDDPIIQMPGKVESQRMQDEILKKQKLKGYSGEDFAAMSVAMEYVSWKMQSLTGQMLQGSVRANPYTIVKDSDSCTYCKYHTICGFDESMPGCKKRDLSSKLKDEEIYGRMKGACDGDIMD